MSDIIHDLSESSLRQYQSCWAVFQNFIRQQQVNKIQELFRQQQIIEIQEEIVFQFLAHLFYKKKLALGTVTTHMAAIADPLTYRFHISLDTRVKLFPMTTEAETRQTFKVP